MSMTSNAQDHDKTQVTFTQEVMDTLPCSAPNWSDPSWPRAEPEHHEPRIPPNPRLPTFSET